MRISAVYTSMCAKTEKYFTERSSTFQGDAFPTSSGFEVQWLIGAWWLSWVLPVGSTASSLKLVWEPNVHNVLE